MYLTSARMMYGGSSTSHHVHKRKVNVIYVELKQLSLQVNYV